MSHTGFFLRLEIQRHHTRCIYIFFFFFKDLMINISAICLKSLWFEINNLMICLKCSSLATLMAEIPLFF